MNYAFDNFLLSIFLLLLPSFTCHFPILLLLEVLFIFQIGSHIGQTVLEFTVLLPQFLEC